MIGNTQIQDVAPMLAEHFIKYQPTFKELETDLGLYRFNSLFQKQLLNLSSGQNFRMTALINKNILSVILNDELAYNFASALNILKGLNISVERLVFPIQLDMEIESISYNLVDRDGFLIEIEKQDLIDKSFNFSLLSSNRGLIKLGFVIWERYKLNPRKKILILVETNNIKTQKIKKTLGKK